MGQFVYAMNVSLDLRIEQVPGDNGAGEWLRIDEELHREFNAQARALALMVQGRVVYEVMEEIGIDMSIHTPHTMDELAANRFDLVVTLSPEAEAAVAARNLEMGATGTITYSFTINSTGGDGKLRNAVVSSSSGGSCFAATLGPDCQLDSLAIHDPLASTGVSIALASVWASLLVGLGGVLVVIGRRRWGARRRVHRV